MTRYAVDIFCGSGGVTAGLKAAGWQIVAAIDNDPLAAATYKKNHKDVAFIESDIQLVETTASLKKYVAGKIIDLVVICAPCQPFSSQNNKRGDDPREQLIIKALDVVHVCNPKIVFFENVPGLASASYKKVLGKLRSNLKKEGFIVTSPLVKDASDFGVPQRRKRCIMLAAKNKEALAAFIQTEFQAPSRKVVDAIGDLPHLESGETDPKDPMHSARTHSELALKRLASIPTDGGSRFSLPLELELKCHVGRKAFPDVYGRMAWNQVAPTLTTGCNDITRGRFAHPEQHRAITLREAARLQTFEDGYVFTGNRRQIATQIGNAVPPKMVQYLAQGLERALCFSV